MVVIAVNITGLKRVLPPSTTHSKSCELVSFSWLVLLPIGPLLGYNPEEASKLWERMKANSEGKKSPPAFLSTHPSNDSRIKNLRALAPSAKAEAEKFGVTSFRKN